MLDADGPELSHSATLRMEKGIVMADRDLIVQALDELIEALYRRVDPVELLGVARIARDSAALRQEAVNRIQELTAAPPSDPDTREDEQSGEVK